MAKRAFDALASLLALILISPMLILVSLWIKLDSKGPVFFRQKRIGKDFKPFFIYKFRTMRDGPPRKDRPITFGLDPRITRAGRLLRKMKIDELPQLINVLKAEMSLVGPRPELPIYVEAFRKDYAEILKVRPGITDLASLKYRNEADVLGRSQSPREDYRRRILPEKIRLAKKYLKEASFWNDLVLLAKTLMALLRDLCPI